MKLSEILEGRKNGDLTEAETSREAFLMDCVRAFIDNNYERNLTRDELADLARMDRYRFSKVFKAQTGKGLKCYVNSVRTGKTAELLRNRELTIAEVAFSVGYRSAAHFCRVFKRSRGLPPNEFREKNLPT